jgi:hypothetical protein
MAQTAPSDGRGERLPWTWGEKRGARATPLGKVANGAKKLVGGKPSGIPEKHTVLGMLGYESFLFFYPRIKNQKKMSEL